MNAASRVAMNTSILYLRMLVTAGITLYTTRVILRVLGSVDYGLFNLVGNIVFMLSFLNTTMATATQRFLSYYQGMDDDKKLRGIFTNSFLLHVLIALILVVGLELAGLFLFDGTLNIPADRLQATRYVYHFMSGTVFFSVLSVPFNSVLIAQENMIWVAIVNVAETLLKLGIAFLLPGIQADKLVIYGGLTALIGLVSLLLYAVYCLVKYRYCSLSGIGKIDRTLMKELTSFAGWSLFGSISGLGRTQGLAILLNIFLGAVMNAAYGIANQIAAQLNFFSATLLRALNPQIMKSEGLDDRARMLRLAMMASKFGFFLLAIIAIPVIFEMEPILTLWLKDVPPYTVIFCQLILLSTLINQLTIGLQSAAQAIGKIKYYQIVIGSVLLFNLVIAYALLKFKFPVSSVLISYACIELLACVLRLLFLKKIGGLSIRLYLSRVIYREFWPVVIMLLCGLLSVHYIHHAYRFMITIPLNALFFAVSIYMFGLCSDEKELLHGFIQKIKIKISKS